MLTVAYVHTCISAQTDIKHLLSPYSAPPHISSGKRVPRIDQAIVWLKKKKIGISVKALTRANTCTQYKGVTVLW